MNQSTAQQRPQPWCSRALLGCTAVTQEGWGGEEKSGLLLKHLVVLAVCGAACVRAICLNMRCLANAFGFTEISVFPVLLWCATLAYFTSWESRGKTPTSLRVILEGFCSCGLPLWAGILQVH